MLGAGYAGRVHLPEAELAAHALPTDPELLIPRLTKHVLEAAAAGRDGTFGTWSTATPPSRSSEPRPPREEVGHRADQLDHSGGRREQPRQSAGSAARPRPGEDYLYVLYVLKPRMSNLRREGGRQRPRGRLGATGWLQVVQASNRAARHRPPTAGRRCYGSWQTVAGAQASAEGARRVEDRTTPPQEG